MMLCIMALRNFPPISGPKVILDRPKNGLSIHKLYGCLTLSHICISGSGSCRCVQGVCCRGDNPSHGADVPGAAPTSSEAGVCQRPDLTTTWTLLSGPTIFLYCESQKCSYWAIAILFFLHRYCMNAETAEIFILD